MNEFPEVCVVEASAGSGKTYALAKRYLYLLINSRLKLRNIPLENILAITFTNKATIEMKERILQLLKKIALDSFSNIEEERDILAALGVDKKFAALKASLVMDKLINNYSSFRVHTIDSFINSLLLGCAMNIDRSASFKIKSDYRDYLFYCFDSVVEQSAVDEETLRFLDDFLEHYLFVENKEGWFPKEDIFDLMRSLFRLTNSYGRPFSYSRGGSAEIIKSKKQVYRMIKDIADNLPKGFNGNAKKSIYSFLDKNTSAFSVSSLPDIFSGFEPSMNKGKTAPPDFMKQWQALSQELARFLEFEAQGSYCPYIDFFRRIMVFLRLVTRKEDILFLEELNHKARLIFDEEGITVAELYYRLAGRFSHYLIDEFQDTSVLQWNNLEMMVEEALSTGGSLFYVGDRKQAIYRFRGGEPALFDSVKERFNMFNVKQTYLAKNWRSQKAIVEFNNEVFSRGNLLSALSVSKFSEDMRLLVRPDEEIADIFKDSIQEYRAGNDLGYVRVERIDEKNQSERDEIMREKIVDLIKELTSCRFHYENIALLARDNTKVELITSWLLAAGIPVESEKTLNAAHNNLVKEVISFLKFLHSPIDDLSFAAFILGDIFSRAVSISVEQTREFIFSLRKERKIGRGAALYRFFRENHPQAWDSYINQFFRSVGFISSYELLTAVYQQFRVLENFPDSQAFFMKFLELVKAKEDEYPGLERFLAYLESASEEELYVNAAGSSAVKILTVHKSKGLEFEVVIIPFLGMNIDPRNSDIGSAYMVEDDRGSLNLLRITQKHRLYSDPLQKIYAQAYQRACISELNNIYVALTRARYEMYIFIPAKDGKSDNKARYLIPQEIKERGSKVNYNLSRSEKEPFINIKPAEYKDWISALKSEFSEAESIKNKENIIQGNIIHYVLSGIDNLFGRDIGEAVKKSILAAKKVYPRAADFELIENQTTALLSKEELKDFFFSADGLIYQEKEVVNNFGDTKRIDRMIVKEKEVWVIDFKSSRAGDEKDKTQVLGYIDIVKDIYQDKKARGFIIYLDNGDIDEIEAGSSRLI